jgi:hypothetical protein
MKWNSLWLILALAALNNWHTSKLDYFLAYPQAPVEKELYMKIPKGFSIDEGKNDDYVLNVYKNIYGQKQAGRVWHHYLVKVDWYSWIHTIQNIDKCVFYQGKTIYIHYTNDSILAGPGTSGISA